MITADNIVSHEFIGLDAEVAESPNRYLVGLNGRIVDETKSMIVMNTAKGTKRVEKAPNTWRFSIEGGDVIVDGSRIAKRPFDRVGERA